jgi:hypothetical protein
MENIVKKLFEAGLLSEDDQKSLQESFDARVEAAATEARELAEQQVREEMSQRVEHDKATLVEAMDRMLTDVVQKYESEKVAESAKLKEAQARASAVAGELRAAYKARLKEHAQVLESFVMQKLSQEIGEFSEDKNAVAGMRIKLASALAENKTAYKARMAEHMSQMRTFVVQKLDEQMKALRKQELALNEQRAALETETATLRSQLEEQFAQRVATVDRFVVQKVAEELREFHEDKRALVEKRVQLVSEARSQLAATQRKFVKEAAKLVDLKVTETMKVELKQLHEDLERNRQNMFGRRIFEAVSAEFMTSYFSDSTEVKKLSAILESKDAELVAAKQKLQESQQATDAASRKAKLAEEAATRTKTMAELLSPLAREKRAVMGELLETVKTTQLREAFTKYLPAVLNEGSKKTAPQSRQTLSEAPKEKNTVAVTGDQRNNRLLETVQAEDTESVSTETATILKLAGLKK